MTRPDFIICPDCGIRYPVYKAGRFPKRCAKCTDIRYEIEQRKYLPHKYNNYRVKTTDGYFRVDKKVIDDLFCQQFGKCAICGTPFITTKTSRGFSIDHDHVTHRIRGLLCGSCNLAIGLIRDNIETSKQITKYLIENAE